MTDNRRPIPPKPPRWQPNPDPGSIHVPGLDTSAPVLDQIEQMEQLITIKLQNIDENFSKIHHLLANKLLPAVKRYAVGTEPVREAAKFWTSFYEQAAQIHIPTYDDYSTVNDVSERQEVGPEPQDPSHAHNTTTSTSHDQSQVYEPSMASTDGSFMPGHAAFSSTPATARVTKINDSFATQTSDGDSWTTSMETPLVRLDRELQKLPREDDDNILGPSTSKQLPALQFDEPTPNPKQHQQRDTEPRSEKGKAKETGQPLLRNVLRHNLISASDMSYTATSAANISPLKFRGKPKTPIPKEYNPYLPPNTRPTEWSGVVDLGDPSVMTPQRNRRGHPSSRRKPATPAQKSDDEDGSFDGLPPGMSPPVMMSPARPPRSSAELGLLKLGQTPMKEASARITRDVIRDLQYKSGGGYGHSRVESTMSTMPTPPSLSRYHRHGMDTTDSIVIDSSLESMIRRVGLNVPPSGGTTSTPGLRLRPRPPLKAAEPPESPMLFPDPDAPAPGEEPMTPAPLQDDDLGMDSDSDSMDEINSTAHPSAAFLMASAHRNSGDSFGSSNNSTDSLAEEDANLGLAPVQPFAISVEDDGFEDSFDDDMYDGPPQEETLFGVPPRQREEQERLVQRGDGLRMLGEDLLQDTMGIGALSGRVDESPTPASWSNQGSGSLG
ncbi:hypothetical protein Hypma_016097 [Hypsizygus marmoreus]|uniref:DASH complex subunit ASK1 n=1 Tax=Hypsizygus marmoreus TaxID=39966 RepID=A0A369KAC4_HYPMA|nr:hypothetical protein Hypma_016097 [Hypsizygus marmoreus]